MNTTTPFDNASMTMAVDCPRLLIPLANESFQEHYTGDEKVELGNETHIVEQPDGTSEKRLTDSHFTIHGKEKTGRYHFECQSTKDNTIQLRMVEYGVQVALEHAEITSESITLELPKAAVIYLRSNQNTPDTLAVTFKTPDGRFTYPIPVIKVKNYTVDELFEKKLYFLIPFHIFVYENSFLLYNENNKKLEELKAIYQDIVDRLEVLALAGELDEHTRHCIMSTSHYVSDYLARNFDAVKKGIGDIMRGQVLDYEAKRIWNAGRTDGWSAGHTEGITEGAKKFCLSLLKDGFISLAEAAKRLGISETELQKEL